MEPGLLLPLCAAALAVAFLYSSVGHGGGSGYIAVMALAGLAPDFIRPTALALNVLVAGLGTWNFHRAGYFSARLFWSCAALSVPAAFLGGWIRLPILVFNFVLGLALLAAAGRFLMPGRAPAATRPASLPAALAAGGGVGFLSGLVGVGGGIFLSPLVILMRWATPQTAAAVSAPFILVNSLSGLAGALAGGLAPTPLALPLAGAVVAGGAAGSWLGSRRFSGGLLKKLLAAVLVVAAGKLLLA